MHTQDMEQIDCNGPHHQTLESENYTNSISTCACTESLTKVCREIRTTHEMVNGDVINFKRSSKCVERTSNYYTTKHTTNNILQSQRSIHTCNISVHARTHAWQEKVRFSIRRDASFASPIEELDIRRTR